ncbi:MAG: DUF58 domain-containing protein [Acidimicrobiales bacterium]|jgi:uncharacterized protein (DUF58 family)
MRRRSPRVNAGETARTQTAKQARLRHLALPERALGPIAGTALLLFVWAGVAHASGSGWVQTVGAVVAGLLLLGLVAPAFAAPGLTLICTASPTDAVAGSVVELAVVANRSMRCTPRSVGGAPLLLTRRLPGHLLVVPGRRGVISAVTIRLATAAPFGLLWWSRDQVLELARPLYVAPQASEHAAKQREAQALEEGSKPPRPTLTGDLRGVRPYQHGDGRRRVHWHASAHTGDLMVRESEMRTDDPIRIVADLPRDEEAADRLAEEAMGEVVAQLRSGRRVVLETTELTGRVVALVADRVSAGRRLARAVSPLEGR